MEANDTYLNFPKLQEYDVKIKEYINKKSFNNNLKSISEEQINDLFKTSGNITLSKTSSVINKGESDTITISDATGPVSVASSDSNVATVSLENNIITITGVNTGSVSITVNVGATDNSKATSQSINVVIGLELQIINSIPTQKGILTYNTEAQSPEWNNYDSEKMSISGVTSSTDAGTYIATFTPTSNYQWSDGTTNTKNVNWVIEKGTLDFDIGQTSVTMNADSTYDVSMTGYTSTYNSEDGYLPKVTAKTNAVGYVHIDYVNTSSSTGAKMRIIGQNNPGTVTITLTTNDNNYNTITKTVNVTLKSSSIHVLLPDPNGTKTMSEYSYTAVDGSTSNKYKSVDIKNTNDLNFSVKKGSIFWLLSEDGTFTNFRMTDVRIVKYNIDRTNQVRCEANMAGTCTLIWKDNVNNKDINITVTVVEDTQVTEFKIGQPAETTTPPFYIQGEEFYTFEGVQYPKITSEFVKVYISPNPSSEDTLTYISSNSSVIGCDVDGASSKTVTCRQDYENNSNYFEIELCGMSTSGSATITLNYKGKDISTFTAIIE